MIITKTISKMLVETNINNELPAQRDELGRFVPGTKIAGRPKGALQATTKEIRQIWTNVVEDHLPLVYADLAAMTPEKRINALVAISQMILPKYSAVAVTNEGTDGEHKKQYMMFGETKIEF